jgi:hypothetical protein
MKKSTLSVLSILVLVVAACGTTTTPEQQEVAEVADGGLDTLESALPPGATVNDKGQVVSADGEVLGSAEDFGISTGGGTSGGSSGGGSSAIGGGSSGGSGIESGSGTVAAAAPGITDTKIFVGAPWSDAGAANQAFAGAALNSDLREPMNAIIKEVNSQGGIAGRKVEPIYHSYDATSSQTIDQQDQAACARYTQDNKVFAILADSDILQQCAEKAGAVTLSVTSTSLPEDFQRYPHFIEISGMNLIRVGDVTIAGLHREGYFDKGAKLGLVTWDEPNYRDAIERGFVPALRKKGITPATDTAYISSPQTADDLAAASADVNNAVLRFQSQGITHVMLIDGSTPLCRGACLGILWLRRSESQNYRPRYGFNAGNAASLAHEQGVYPTEQVRRSIAVEWDDSDKAADEGWKLNKARERCYAIMRKHNVSLDNGNKEADARTACEFIWFMRQVIDVELADAQITSDNFIAGVNALGWSYTSPMAYAVHLSATQHDGTAAARNQKFVDSCECFRWTGDPYRV